MNDIAEIIKAVADLVKAAAWPCAVFASVWILREPLRALIEKIKKITIGHGDTKAELEISQEIAKVEPLDEQTRTLMLKLYAESKSKASLPPSLRDPQKEQALRALMENALKNLEALISISEKVPWAAIKESWEILSKNVVETAQIFGFRRDEEGDSDLSQAVFYLTVGVLESQQFMVDVYALATVIQRVDKTPNADVSPKDAQDFVRACIAILTRMVLTIENKNG